MNLSSPSLIRRLFTVSTLLLLLLGVIMLLGISLGSTEGGINDVLKNLLGYEDMDSLQGVALKNIVPLSEVDFGKAHAIIDSTRCTGCGTCTRILCRAMDLIEDLAVNNEEKCTGCGFCAMFCTEEAITIVRD